MYGTYEGSLAYHEARGRQVWVQAHVDNATAALVRGSTALDAIYGVRFFGKRTGGPIQEHAWPRVGLQMDRLGVLPDVIPIAVQHAAYELAYAELITPGIFTRIHDPAKQAKMVKVGPITKEYATPSGAGSATFSARLAAVDGLLSDFLRNTGFNTPVILVV